MKGVCKKIYMSIKDLKTYELVKEEKLLGIHSEGYLLRHKKSGARVLLIENEDVAERAKIVTLEDVRKRDYSLAVNQYIERKEQEKVAPSEVRKEYFEALEEVYRAQERMRKLLIAGGYVSERQDNH